LNKTKDRDTSLRIVTCNVEPAAYRLVNIWAREKGHTVALIVTTPGPPPREYTGHQEIVASAPPNQDILVTTRLKRAAPLIAAAAPDVLLSYTFPLRIPDEVLAIPRLGAVNLHPSPLPAYRGPNPARMVYDGAATLGATLHRTTAGFDAGPILSRVEAAMPSHSTVENVLDAWHPILTRALDEGMARLTTGARGDVQDENLSSYAAPFSEAEHWLEWDLTALELQRRATALNLLRPLAQACLDGATVTVNDVTPIPYRGENLPGDIIERGAGYAVVAVADGAVRVSLTSAQRNPDIASRGGEVVERDIAGG
jgi:methionyl-tRNA formyltransferase